MLWLSWKKYILHFWHWNELKIYNIYKYLYQLKIWYRHVCPTLSHILSNQVSHSYWPQASVNRHNTVWRPELGRTVFHTNTLQYRWQHMFVKSTIVHGWKMTYEWTELVINVWVDYRSQMSSNWTASDFDFPLWSLSLQPLVSLVMI